MVMSLYISRTFRERRLSTESESFPGGKVPVGSAAEARHLADRLGLMKDGPDAPADRPTAGEVAALALLDDAYQAILESHLRDRDATLVDRLLAILRAQLGLDLLDRLLLEFAEEFLGARFQDLALLVDGFSGRSTDNLDRGQIIKQIVVFWLLHENPAAKPIVSRIHSAPLLQVPAFRSLFVLMAEVLEKEPAYEGGESNLWEMLTRPQRLSPDSLSGQLFHLRQQWSSLLGDLTSRLDSFIGMMAEERAPRFPPGPGPTEAPRLEDAGEEVRFSPDRGWMAELVMVAKHTLVWLNQLGTTYQRPVERLDQVPDEELDRLARLGFNGLWLIGLWQRSPASRQIKHLCGNPEAEASAYSLVRYSVSDQLGGDQALADLQRRAAGFGIRLAADMVPNHTGLDSDWMVEHPDWFIGQTECPFPVYRFDGQDLSSRPEIGVYLEDHYFDRSDAAVVFKRIDHQTGAVRFIYHGNDGTSMPWNDTAQLDYLNPEVREAVIETIVDVARRFPIIRFDAAMTLARRHYQRLWFPAPGTAGDIPSRAEHGMSQEEFQAAMPQEFWRQVVDRVAEEAPDTLLLAEAFWLMEGYFVRTLGMHRVYNSAFMNMLRDGETEKFRQLIKETLVFDPGILKRYVNFMSNPDEQSAIEQFGDGDRFIGTSVLMSTLPGLPMFGHGQVEGFRERYGMEYRQAYWDEQPREDLLDRHLREVAPLLEERQTFADVSHFRLFDLVTFGGDVNGNVLAYSNGSGEDATLVLFNNSGFPAHGRVKTSVPFLPSSEGRGGDTETVEVAQALLPTTGDYWEFRDPRTAREFLVDDGDLRANGLEIDLAPWESRVLRDFRSAAFETEMASLMIQRIGSRGVDSLAAVRREIELEPMRAVFASALNKDLMRRLMKLPGGLSGLGEDDSLLEEMVAAVEEMGRSTGQTEVPTTSRLLALLTLPELARRLTASGDEEHKQAGRGLQGALQRRPEVLPALFCWVLITTLYDSVPDPDVIYPLRDLQLESTVLSKLISAGGEPETVGRLISVLEQALRAGWGRRPVAAPEAEEFQHDLLNDDEIRRTLGAHQFEGCEYIGREALESVIDWRLLLEAQAWSAGSDSSSRVPEEVGKWWQVLHRLASDAEESSYRTDQLGVVETAPLTPLTD